MPQLKVENLYNTVITEAGGIPASGDCDFTVATPPENSNGFIIISPENEVSREVMYYHNVIGNRIYVRGVNRSSPKAHAPTEVVKINDVAEIFNTFSDMISQAFYIEKTGGLTIKVWGGYVYYNGAAVAVPDTNLTLVNGTNYIKYDYPTNTVSSDLIASGNIKVEVTVLAGIITSIVYRNAKESFIDFTVAITGALPSQSGNAGKVLFTNGTTVFWGSVGSPATTTAIGSTELSTDIETATGASTGAAGPLSMSPANLENVYYFGDGSDGDVVISTNTSLARDMYYNNLTVNTGINLDPNGFAIYVLGTLTLSGTAKIIRNGNNGTAGGAPTTGVGGAALTTGTCGTCLGGGNGGAGIITGTTGNGIGGTAGVAVNPSFAVTGSSATAGAGGQSSPGGFSGGSAGANATHTRGTEATTVLNFPRAMARLAVLGRTYASITQYGGLASAGGGGGGGLFDPSPNSSGGGGGGGGNGGIIFVFANTIAGTGTIEARGGNGGNGGSTSGGARAGGGGGGAGGSGGIVFFVYKSGTPYTITLTGGTGGTGGTPSSTGSAGGNGATGTTGTSIITQV